MEGQAFNKLVLSILDDLEITALKNVLEGGVCHLIPFDFNSLCGGNDIFLRSVYFLKGVASADQNIVEGCDAICISHSIFIHFSATQRSAVKMESNAFDHTVLGGLCNLDATAFQFVVELVLGNFIPLDHSILAIGNDILCGSINLFQGIACADKDIGESGNAACVGRSVEVNALSGSRSTVKTEPYTFVHIILRGLDDLEITSFQNVIEAHSCRLTAGDGNSLRLLGLIVSDGLLSDGISAGAEVVDHDFAIASGFNGLIHAISGNREGNAGNLTVFRSLNDLSRAKADLQIEIALNRVVYFCSKGRQVLLTFTRLIHAIRPNNNAASHRSILGGRNRHGVRRSLVCGDSERVAADRKINTGCVCAKGVVAHCYKTSKKAGVIIFRRVGLCGEGFYL